MTEQEKQKIIDEEHLKLLRIGYIVAGIADAFFAMIPLIYVFMGIFIAAGLPKPTRPGEPDPAVFGMIFAVVGLVFVLILGAQAVLKLLTARALGRRSSRILCLIAAGLSCVQLPWGTMLGVFTFMVMGRTSVKELFEPSVARLAPPPARMASSLFNDDEAIRRQETAGPPSSDKRDGYL